LDEPDGGDGEAALVEGHERYHVPSGRVWHGLVGRDDPLDRLSEGRQLARLNETKELLVGDIGAAQLDITPKKSRASWERKWRRRCGGERTRSSRGKREGERKQTESKVLNQRSTRGFKGDRTDSSSSAPSPPCQQDFRPLTRASRRNSHTQPRRLDSRDVQTCRA
jgi:hypothetical protein